MTYAEAEARRPGVLSARRDAVVLAVLISAVLLLIWNGSAFFNHLVVERASFATDIRIASTALTLNVALILFGWRRYVDLQHEAEVRTEQERRAALLATQTLSLLIAPPNSRTRRPSEARIWSSSHSRSSGSKRSMTSMAMTPATGF